MGLLVVGRGRGPDSDKPGHLVGKRRSSGDSDKRTDCMISVPLDQEIFAPCFTFLDMF